MKVWEDEKLQSERFQRVSVSPAILSSPLQMSTTVSITRWKGGKFSIENKNSEIIRDVSDTTLPNIGFNRIVIYRIPDILDTIGSMQYNWPICHFRVLQPIVFYGSHWCQHIGVTTTYSSMVIYPFNFLTFVFAWKNLQKT